MSISYYMYYPPVHEWEQYPRSRRYDLLKMTGPFCEVLMRGEEVDVFLRVYIIHGLKMSRNHEARPQGRPCIGNTQKGQCHRKHVLHHAPEPATCTSRQWKTYSSTPISDHSLQVMVSDPDDPHMSHSLNSKYLP